MGGGFIFKAQPLFRGVEPDRFGKAETTKDFLSVCRALVLKLYSPLERGNECLFYYFIESVD